MPQPLVDEEEPNVDDSLENRSVAPENHFSRSGSQESIEPPPSRDDEDSDDEEDSDDQEEEERILPRIDRLPRGERQENRHNIRE